MGIHPQRTIARYMKVYGVTLLIAAGILSIPFFAALHYLRVMGEVPMSEVIEAQLQNRGKKICLFGSGLVNGDFNYKTALYDRIQPDVVGLGSSRVLNFRSDMFTGSFLTLGGGFNSLSEGEALVKHILARHKPKLILFGIDYWWFNNIYIPASYHFSPPPTLDEPMSPVTKFLKVISFVLEGKVTLSEIISASSNPFYDNCHFGLTAKKYRDGFAPDGSYYYGGFVTGLRKSDDPRFLRTLNKVRNGISRFSYNSELDPAHLATFERIVTMLQQSGVPTVYFFTPFPKVLDDAMAQYADGYGYIKKLHEYLKNKGLTVYDFSDMTPYGGTDCEFLEGIHGGDVLYARMLEQLAERDPRARPWLDAPHLKDYLRYAGYAMKPRPEVIDAPEIDFLGLGCKKTPQ